ncbi:MAG: acetylornithine deacetylase [Rhodobacteraceae bacterium]|nr:MAG: acetylornithine deacetylase [Paracoccaceae bacterium]
MASKNLSSIEILEKLISFPTISKTPNIELINWVSELLGSFGIRSTILRNEDGSRANLFATSSDTLEPGIMLSGHTDVVPTDGQNWHTNPFELKQSGGKLFGRGTADMKGFCASAIRIMCEASNKKLNTPLHLALSFDEEIGCIGVRSLIEMLKTSPVKPKMCIVGEPTLLAVASGHKGKIALQTTCKGIEGHSALAPLALNALHLGTDFVNIIREVQKEIINKGNEDNDYDVPYTTLHVGKMNGGVALNIVPNICTIDWEIRNLANDSTETILTRVKELVELKLQEYKNPEAEIFWQETFSYPGLGTDINSEIINFVRSLTGTNNTIKVAFGTEGGLFHKEVGIPTVVCGPGSMLQGHKPNEFITVEQMDRCDLMMENLLSSLKEK